MMSRVALRASTQGPRLLNLSKRRAVVKQSTAETASRHFAHRYSVFGIRVAPIEYRFPNTDYRSGRTFDSVLRHLPGDGVAVQAEQLGGIPNASPGALQGAGNEDLLELPPGILVEDALVEHLLDEPVELIPHVTRAPGRRGAGRLRCTCHGSCARPPRGGKGRAAVCSSGSLRDN